MVLRLLQLLLLLAVLRAVWRLVRGVLEGAGYQRVDGGGAVKTGVKLVRDPNCGTFVSPSRSPAIRLGGQTLYFCSDKCRREWEKR
jgi:YHS domain-containing protein